MPIPINTYRFWYLAENVCTGNPVLQFANTCQYIPLGRLQHNTVTPQTLQAQHIRNVCNITHPKLWKRLKHSTYQTWIHINTETYGLLRRISLQIPESSGSTGLAQAPLGSTQAWPSCPCQPECPLWLRVARAGPAMGHTQLEVDSPWPALGRTRLAQACSGPYMTCPCLLRSHRAAGQQHSTWSRLARACSGPYLPCPCQVWLTPKPGPATP